MLVYQRNIIKTSWLTHLNSGDLNLDLFTIFLKKISQKQNDFKTTLIILAWIGFKYYINTYMYLLTYVTKYFGYSNNKNWYVFLIFIKCMTQCSNRMTLKKNQNIVLLICIKWHTLQNCGSVYLLRMWHSHARYDIVVINKTNFSYCK